MPTRASGVCLVGAASLFWLAWLLMPGVGVTDAARILGLVAEARAEVVVSVVLQLLSAALYAPAMLGVAAIPEGRVGRGVRHAATLLLVGAMGSAADSVFHLLAFAMTQPDLERESLLRVMELMQGPGLLLIAPLLACLFVGGAWLAVGLARAGLVGRGNPVLYAVALAFAIGGGAFASAGGVEPRLVGLGALLMVSVSQVWLGVALARAGEHRALGGVRRARAVLWSFAALLTLAFATYVAGELTEVVVLRTFDADGTAHDTKMWVVDEGGTPWVRVANPERAWYRRLVSEPRAELLRRGHRIGVRAHPEDSDAARDRIDRLFHEKYGAVDAWYGLLLRRRAIPIRLEPGPGTRSSRAPRRDRLASS